ncbi:MAG: GAF domain-containing protein [Pseudomonadota bacterium]
MSMFDVDPLDARSLDIAISELLVATADGCDAYMDRKITETLRMLRLQMNMDMVFVSEFVDGNRVFRFVDSDRADAPQAGDAGALEDSYCQRIVQGRVPEFIPDTAPLIATGALFPPPIPVGAHLSTPVVLKDGRVYGTVCCLSAAAQPDLQAAELERLRQCARLVARKVEGNDRPDFAPTEPDWSLTVSSGKT